MWSSARRSFTSFTTAGRLCTTCPSIRSSLGSALALLSPASEHCVVIASASKSCTWRVPSSPALRKPGRSDHGGVGWEQATITLQRRLAHGACCSTNRTGPAFLDQTLPSITSRQTHSLTWSASPATLSAGSLLAWFLNTLISSHQDKSSRHQQHPSSSPRALAAAIALDHLNLPQPLGRIILSQDSSTPSATLANIKL